MLYKVSSRLLWQSSRLNFAHKAIQPRQSLSTTTPKFGGGGEYVYRGMPKAERKYEIWADVASGFMWWWIFWHLFTDYGHIIGEFPFPDASSWTDEELGIPPLDADDPE